ncbi:MAG: DUF547 domain-containing protein [Ferruginibacter sp.]
MFRILVLASLLMFSMTGKGQTGSVISHQAYNSLLQKYVSAAGKVNYKGLKKEKAVLEGYLQELSKSVPDKTWNKNASLAYWINAYNAFTIKLILDNYPVSSITKLHNGKPWDVKWILLGGKTYSLNNIENDIIRPQYNDPRIHFAVNCAAVSCPPLSNTAFTESNINSLLTSRATSFINSAANELSASKIKLSKIFEWYKTDFGNTILFINKYSKTKINDNAIIEYKDYDWNLNE